jgi:hypothetical protein
MTEEKNYYGLGIGIIFTIGSLLLAFTYFVPIISVLPGAYVESIAKGLIDNDPYSNVGKLTILLLTIVFFGTLLFALIQIRKTILSGRQVSKTKITIIMTVLYFIVHSLGFYIYWGLALNFRSDGQLAFAAVDSFPKSSWTFIPIGLIIDGVKNFKLKQTNKSGSAQH